jgi:hypothetical protein
VVVCVVGVGVRVVVGVVGVGSVIVRHASSTRAGLP